MKTVIVCLFGFSVLLFPVSSAHSQPLIGMWAELERINMYVEPGEPFNTFECFVFVRPGADGSSCLEFSIDLPDNVILIGYTLHPDFGVPIDPIQPWISPGASWCFEPCRTDWFWTHCLNLITLDQETSFIKINPHGSTGNLSTWTCHGVREDMYRYCSFGVNEIGSIITPYPVIIPFSIELATYTVIVAEFDPPLDGDDFFLVSGSVQAMDYPEDHIPVVESMLHPRGDGSIILTFASPMTHGRWYWLNAYTCAPGGCGTTTTAMYFNEEISVEQATWGSIKSLLK